MKSFYYLLAILPLGLVAVPACSSSSDPSPAGPGAGADGGADTGVPQEDSGGGGGTQCTAARNDVLKPVSKASTAEVKVVKTEGDVTTLYVDASAGGTPTEIGKNARVYVKLPSTRVDVTDVAALESGDWDLALKRTLLFTNSGDTGKGKGGGARVDKAFAAVTAADANEVKPEQLFDDNCEVKLDGFQIDPATTFADWYDYDLEGGHKVMPKKDVTFIVQSADGTKKYKVAILSFYAKPDGATDNTERGFYLLQVAPL
jgi:heme-binding HmuY-like protein